MRLVIISDTHGLHPWLDMPEGDVLVHCGDWCQDYGSVREMKAFADWMAEQPYDHKVAVAGNHDFPAQDNDARVRGNFRKRGIHYLRDSAVEIDGIKFYGAPWQPAFGDMAFNLPRGEALWDKWRRVPKDVDVLVSHGPPKGILDNPVPPDDPFRDPLHVGCDQLLRRVRQVRPKLHCFGHVHSPGAEEHDGVVFVNAASLPRQLDMGVKPSERVAREAGLRRPVVVDVGGGV